jgi:hypothetical protein
VAEFRYLRATEWDMRWARVPIAEKPLDPETYVHHTAGSHPNNAITAFQQLNEYAINTKGYSAIDYDILVHRDTRTGLVTIGEGRGKWMSAATLDRNEQGEAIVLFGHFHPGSTLTRHPHPDELEGIALGIVWGIDHGWISPTTIILGHRDNPAHPGATGCPGDYLQAQLPTIRARVAELLAPPAPDPQPLPEDLPMTFLWKPAGFKNVFLVDGGGAVHCSPALLEHSKKMLVPTVADPVPGHSQMLKSVLNLAGCDISDLVKE